MALNETLDRLAREREPQTEIDETITRSIRIAQMLYKRLRK